VSFLTSYNVSWLAESFITPPDMKAMVDVEYDEIARDGARSFYCNDPEENTVQLIFHPPIVATTS